MSDVEGRCFVSLWAGYCLGRLDVVGVSRTLRRHLSHAGIPELAAQEHYLLKGLTMPLRMLSIPFLAPLVWIEIIQCKARYLEEGVLCKPSGKSQTLN